MKTTNTFINVAYQSPALKVAEIAVRKQICEPTSQSNPWCSDPSEELDD